MSQAAQTTRAQPQEHTLVHFEIPAKDPQKLSSFYQQLFGWKFAKWEGPEEYWLISPQGSTGPEDSIGGLYRRQNPNEQYRNFFLVRAIDESIKKATNLGARVLTGKQEVPNVGYTAILSDPEGNTFAFFQPTGRM